MTLRAAALGCAGLVTGAALLLAGCSQASPAASPAHSAARPAVGSAPLANGPAQPAAGAGAPSSAARAPAPSGAAGTPAARLDLAGQSIVFTASLTVRAGNVLSAARRATDIAAAVGGYVSGEHASAAAGHRSRSTVSLQLKIPVAAYPATLGRLSTVLGTQTSLTQQAQDVTQQVADVSSRAASARAAITQLQALLRRAGSIGDLLNVQGQINAQESALEALQAQQRALARQTSYATVSVLLVSPPPPARKHNKHPKKQAAHGFPGGLTAGWHGLRIAVAAILTVLGAALPFAALAAVLAAAGYAGRRRLRRILRRGSPPTPAG